MDGDAQLTADRAGAVARQAFDWVASVAVDVEGGLAWRDAGAVADDLYAGTAGVLLGAVEAGSAGADLPGVAAGARDRLVWLAGRGDAATSVPDDGLFTGWAGIAVALRAWAALTGDVVAAAAAREVTTQIAGRVLHASAGACTDVISGHAGILVALLTGDRDPAVDVPAAAAALADRLVAAAEPLDPESAGPEPVGGGVQWRMEPGYPILMPNFSHGTAGVAYALVLAARRLDRPDLFALARRGAQTLLGLGHTPTGWALPMTIPRQEHRPAVSYGWCHGPTGTVRLFSLLAEDDPDPRWSLAVDACLQAVADSRVPARLYAGYWDNVARCCGTAGVGTMLLERYRATGDAAVLAWTDRLAADVVSRARPLPGGLGWSNTEHTADPPELPPEPGLMQGAAGIAGWLARLDAVHAGGPGAGIPVGVTPGWL